jgi:hypothetical protein
MSEHKTTPVVALGGAGRSRLETAEADYVSDLVPEFTVWIVRRGSRFPMVVDSIFMDEARAHLRAQLLGTGHGWHVERYSHLKANTMALNLEAERDLSLIFERDEVWRAFGEHCVAHGEPANRCPACMKLRLVLANAIGEWLALVDQDRAARSRGGAAPQEPE